MISQLSGWSSGQSVNVAIELQEWFQAGRRCNADMGECRVPMAAQVNVLEFFMLRMA